MCFSILEQICLQAFLFTHKAATWVAYFLPQIACLSVKVISTMANFFDRLCGPDIYACLSLLLVCLPLPDAWQWGVCCVSVSL